MSRGRFLRQFRKTLVHTMRKRFLPGLPARIVMVFSTFVSLSAVVVSLWAMQVDPKSKTVCEFSAIFWGVVFSGSCYEFVRIHHESLEVVDGSIVRQSLFGVQRFELATATVARWKTRSGGILELSNDSEKIRIVLEWYGRDDKLWLIEFFRRALPAALQHDWDRFCHWVAMPLREREDPRGRPPAPDEVLVTRGARDRLFIPLIALSVEVGGGLAWLFQQNQFWFFPVAVIVGWLSLRFDVPPEGAVEKRLTMTIGGDTYWFLVFMAAWSGVGFAGIVLFSCLGRRIPHPWLLSAIALAIWFAVLVVWVFYADRKTRELRRPAERYSAEKWDREFLTNS
jgi:hypothetical protein